MAMLQRRGLSSTQQSWPGTRAKVCVLDSCSNQHSILELKIITTRVCGHRNIQDGDENDVNFVGGALVFPSGGKSALEVRAVITCWYRQDNRRIGQGQRKCPECHPSE